MSFINEWALSVTATILISAVLSVLVPTGSMGKMYKTVIAVFIFASFIIPFTSFNTSDFDFSDLSVQTDFSFESEEVIKNNYDNMIVAQIEKILKECDLDKYDIEVKSQVKDYEYSVTECNIVLYEKNMIETVSQKIEEETGIKANVVNGAD